MLKIKYILAILILVELILFGLVTGSRCYDRRDLARAIAAYAENPTPETQETLRKEKIITRRILISVDAAMLLVLLANSMGIIVVSKKLRKSHNQKFDPTRDTPVDSANA